MAQSYPSHQDTADARMREGQDTIHQLKQKAGDVADTVVNEGGKAMKAAGESAENAFDATKRFVQDQPYIAIGAVVVAACAIGALWKVSSSARRNPDLLDRLQGYAEPGYRALRRHL